MRNRRKWNRLAAFALSAALLIPTQAVYAGEGREANVEMETYAEGREADVNGFEIKDGVLVRYTGTATEVVIPAGVTSIGSSAFSGCSGLASVAIPNSVTSIGEGAFAYCNGLTSVAIPNSVTSIGSRAFSDCRGLTSVEISSGVTSIGGGAFWGCSKLASIEIPSSVTSIGDSAFGGTEWLEKRREENPLVIVNHILIDGKTYKGDVVIPDGVTSIGGSAFSGCSGLTSVAIPSSVTSIGYSAFYGCSGLTSVAIPSSVTSIEMWAFRGCSGLASIEIPSSVTSIRQGVFYGCSELASIEIPSSVTSIERCAFEGCSKLASIEIPSSVTSIEDSAFGETEWLEKRREETPLVIVNHILIDGKTCKGDVAIPDGVTSICGEAFDGCSGLTGITIPSSVTSIRGGRFSGCGNLVSIKVAEGNPVYDSRENCNAVIDTKNNVLVCGCKGTVILSSVTDIGDSAFEGVSGLESITIPSSVAGIGDSAFWGCSDLTSVTIMPNVKYIKRYAFFGCPSLASITIPPSVTYIDDLAGIDDIENVTIYGMPGSYAETYAKQKNIKFAAIGKKTIADKDVTISPASYAYDGRVKRPAVTVRDGNKTLKAGADYDVSYQNNINAGTAKAVVKGKGNYQGTVTKTFTIAVRNGTYHTVGAYKYQVTSAGTASVTGAANKKIARIKIPGTVTIGGKRFQVTAIGKNAFRKNTKATSIEIADSVKIIGTSSFEGCTKLTKVTVGKGVTEIGGKAFKGCRKLGRITIKSASLNRVGKNALKGIKGTARIKVPSKKLVSYRKLFKNKGQGRKVKVTR